MQWRSVDSLQSLLTCSGHLGSTLYYRVLDMPLADWESMKTVKVWLPLFFPVSTPSVACVHLDVPL